MPRPGEASAYRERVRGAAVHPVDLSVLSWYLTHIDDLENRLRNAADANPCLDLLYEDLFGEDIPLDERLLTFRRPLDFLGYSTNTADYDAAGVRMLPGPDGKLNTPNTLTRIPNLQEIERRFGLL